MYQDDFEDLQGQFVRLFSEVTEAFKKNKSVTAKKLKKFLSYYPDLEASLVNAGSISDMMRILKNHSTFICCSRLKNVAEHFKISSVTEKIKVYFQYLEDFCSRKLTKHIYLKPFITAVSMEFAPLTTLTFKLEWNPDDKTLSDIQGVLRRVFHEHSVYVHIVVVRGGSVRVICCAPQYLMTELVRLAQKNRELLVESSVTYLRVGDTIVVDTSDQNEVRICYHRNCVTFDFYHQISLVEDLVLQQTIALQLKSEKATISGLAVRKRKRVTIWTNNFFLNRLQTGHKNLKGRSVSPPLLETLQVTMATIYTTSICSHFLQNIMSRKFVSYYFCEYTNT